MGVLGFCLGGTLALDLAARRADLAVVTYYAFPEGFDGRNPVPAPIDVADDDPGSGALVLGGAGLHRPRRASAGSASGSPDATRISPSRSIPMSATASWADSRKARRPLRSPGGEPASSSPATTTGCVMTPVTIHGVSTELVDLPLRRRHSFSTASADHQSYVIVCIQSEDGIHGLGEGSAPAGPWWGAQTVEAIQAVIDRYLGARARRGRRHPARARPRAPGSRGAGGALRPRGVGDGDPRPGRQGARRARLPVARRPVSLCDSDGLGAQRARGGRRAVRDRRAACRRSHPLQAEGRRARSAGRRAPGRWR